MIEVHDWQEEKERLGITVVKVSKPWRIKMTPTE